MSDDLTIELVNSMRSLETRVESLAKGLGAAKNNVNDVGNAMRLHIGEAEQTFKKMNHEIYETGHALSSVGGLFGEIAHKGAGAFRFEGGLQGVALAAAGTGLAFSLMKDAIAHNNEEMERTIDLSQKLGNAIREAKIKGAEAILSSSESQAGDDGKLFSRLGQAGLDSANAISQYGIGHSDAVRGISKSAFIKNNQARSMAVYAAMRAAQTREITFEEGMDIAVRDRGLQGRLAHMPSTGDNRDDIAARLIAVHRGSSATRDNLDSIKKEFGRSDSGFMSQLNGLTAIGNEMPIAGMSAIASGAARATKRIQVDNAIDPDIKARADFHMQGVQEVAKNQEIANGHLNIIAGGLARIVDFIFAGPTGTPKGLKPPHELIFGWETAQDKANNTRAKYEEAEKRNAKPANDG